VAVCYHNAEEPEERAGNVELLGEIETRGLLYPVTVVDGVPFYDGAVSYPAIVRAVASKIAEREAAESDDTP
jgi:hypothetical protein